MMENGARATFPVVFFDGETEIDIGDVSVHPSLDFKGVQSILSQKIGISPHQISIYLDCPKKSRSYPDRRRRIPITGKVNLAAMIHQRDSFFIVVLKRSRRERRRKPTERNDFQVYDDDCDCGYKPWSPSPEKLIILRRPDQNLPFVASGYIRPFYDPISSFDLQMQREKYLTAMNNYDSYSRRTTTTINYRDRVVCVDCCTAEEDGETAPFHWCVYDAVTVGFRSPAGPIARPVKSSN